MNRDPFDTLRSHNPAPPESLPEAPMPLASRITAGRPSLRSGLALAAAAAVVVLVAGGGWLLWGRSTGRDVVATSTPSSASTSTPATAPTTTVPPSTDLVSEAVVYFLTPDFLGHPSLIPVARDLRVLNVSPLPDLVPLTLELLLAGPGAWDAAPLPEPIAAAEAGLTTAVPEGTRLLSLDIAEGTATVDLSAEFAGAPAEAVGQVVFTLTRLEDVTGVRFLIEGVPYSAVAGLQTLVPTASPPDEVILEDPATRLTFEGLMPLAMIEIPPLGGTLQVPGTVAGVANPNEWRVGLTLTDVEGTVLWQTEVAASCGTPWQTCRGEYDWSIFSAAVPAGLVDYGQWGIVRTFVFSGDDPPQPYAFREHLVWLEPVVPFTDEPDLPEATTTLPAEVTTSAVAAGKAPWSGEPLAAEAVPALVGETWTAAEHGDRCAVLYPADPASLAADAALHDRYFGGDWGLAWDLPSGPGRWEPGGEYCPDCGREAFGIGGTYFPGLDYDEDAIWPNRLAWSDGSHAGYGYEGLAATGSGGEPLLAYLFVEGQGCIYNVWSYLGEDHLLLFISQLRFVEGMIGGGGGPAVENDLDELRPFPAETLNGCAAGTARHVAAFEAALADGPLSLEALCALVGVPDYETGSGLYIPVYDLVDGSRLYLGYAAPWGDGLMYARLEMPDGSARDLLEP